MNIFIFLLFCALCKVFELVVLLLCRLMVVLSCQTKLLCALLRLKMQNIRKTKLNVSSLGTWLENLSTLGLIAFIKKALVSAILTGLFIQ